MLQSQPSGTWCFPELVKSLGTSVLEENEWKFVGFLGCIPAPTVFQHDSWNSWFVRFLYATFIFGDIVSLTFACLPNFNEFFGLLESLTLELLRQLFDSSAEYCILFRSDRGRCCGSLLWSGKQKRRNVQNGWYLDGWPFGTTCAADFFGAVSIWGQLESWLKSQWKAKHYTNLGKKNCS